MNEPKPLCAVLGGSFDPPHLGHSAIVLDLLENAGAEMVLIVPSWHHPLKTQGSVASYYDRISMMGTALSRPFGNKVRISTVEQRIEDSRTFVVLTALAKLYTGFQLKLVVGTDILQESHKWYRWDDIQEQFGLIVYDRDGYPSPPGTRKATHTNISSTAIREALAHKESVEGLVDPYLLLHLLPSGVTHGLRHPHHHHRPRPPHRCMYNGHKSSPPGAGMSMRPYFYSGRGAITSDLKDAQLEVIYQCIKDNEVENCDPMENFPLGAADAFVEMVAAIPKLSATDFLKCLDGLNTNEWVWNDSLLEHLGGDGYGSDGDMAPEMAMIGMLGSLGGSPTTPT